MALGKDDAPSAAKRDSAAQSAEGPADLGVPTPDPLRELAKDLPEKDEVQKAVKAAMLADSGQEETKEKVKVVKASPNADETPSGHALIKTAGISDDSKRGEAYAREKTAKRWGHVSVEES